MIKTKALLRGGYIAKDAHVLDLHLGAEIRFAGFGTLRVVAHYGDHREPCAYINVRCPISEMRFWFRVMRHLEGLAFVPADRPHSHFDKAEGEVLYTLQ